MSSFVDVEGTIVWTQEYLLYRVSGCDHEEAIARVMRQIDGAPFQGTCTSGTRPFPPRNEPFDFRARLEAKYRDGLRRGAVQTFVDVEGDIVWTQEYLRYRVSGCSHQQSIDKVLTQIGGGGVPAACSSTGGGGGGGGGDPDDCRYRVTPTDQSVAASGGDHQATVTTTSGCQWTATAGASWITILSGSSGTRTGTIRYRVAANSGSARNGTVQVRWPTATAGENVQVRQAAPGVTPPQASFTWSPNPCPLVGANNGTDTRINCTFDATGSSPQGSITKYTWDFRNVPGSPGGDIVERTTATITNVSIGCSVPGGSYDRAVTLTITTSSGTASVTRNVTFRKDSGC